MKKLVPSTGNFTILGNRRIGKTSLLKEIGERLKFNNVRIGEVYGATKYSTEEVVYRVLQSLDQFRDAEKCLQRPKGVAPAVHGLIENDKRSVAVFIDELDRILEFDAKQDWELLNILRETFEGHPSCRVFFAGFRKVMEVQRSMESPLFNFTTPIELPLFTAQETRDMVNKPLERLGVPVATTDLQEVIYRETAGHPELIQIHCTEIIRFVEEHGSVPSGADLLTDVFNNEEFKQKVLGAFLANTNVLEELLCYLLTADADKVGITSEYEFGHQEVNRVLKEVGISLGIRHIDGIIHNLKVSGIISPVVGAHQKFRFSAPQLANYFIGINLKFCIEHTLERVRESPENAGVWTEPSEDEPRRLAIYDAV
jgi:type II secretory pathway predicted ATPase ExeA